MWEYASAWPSVNEILTTNTSVFFLRTSCVNWRTRKKRNKLTHACVKKVHCWFFRRRIQKNCCNVLLRRFSFCWEGSVFVSICFPLRPSAWDFLLRLFFWRVTGGTFFLCSDFVYGNNVFVCQFLLLFFLRWKYFRACMRRIEKWSKGDWKVDSSLISVG